MFYRHLKRSFIEIAFDIMNHILLIALIVITIYPAIYVFASSFSDGHALMRHSGFILFPIEFSLEAYTAVFKNPLVWSGYTNILTILVVQLPISMILTAISGYFMSRKDVLWKKPIIMLIIFTMYFSGGLIPMYLLVSKLGMIDSLWSLILPFSLNTFNTIIMRTAFMAIPDSMEESARIDGAGHITILIRILLPLTKATIAVLMLYYTIWTWNAWFWSSVFIRTRELYPLQLLLREILIRGEMSLMSGLVDGSDVAAISESIKHATTVIATLPILCVYPFVQKYFTKGVMLGALKG